MALGFKAGMKGTRNMTNYHNFTLHGMVHLKTRCKCDIFIHLK